MDNILPKSYWWDSDAPWFVQEIIVHWLDLEVDDLAEEKMPILQQMIGFRNREVHDYVHEFVMDRMDRIAIEMYGHG